MDQEELYAKHAQASATLPGSTDPRTRDLVALITRGWDRTAKGFPRIIELGFGSGELTFEIAKRMLDSRVLGIDLAKDRVDLCSQRAAAENLSNRLSFQVLDLEKGLAQIPTGSADIVVAIDVLEHLFDVFQFVDQLSRVLSTGGRLILRVPNAAYVRRRLELLLGNLPVTASWFGPENDLQAWRTTWGWDGGHLHFFTLGTLRALLEGAGFSILACTDPGVRFRRLRAAMPGLFYGNLCLVAERCA